MSNTSVTVSSGSIDLVDMAGAYENLGAFQHLQREKAVDTLVRDVATGKCGVLRVACAVLHKDDAI